MATQPFSPGTTTVVPTTTSSVANAIVNARSGASVRLKNRGAAGEVIYFEFGNAGASASVAGSMSIDPGGIEPFTLPEGVTHIAVIVESGEPKLEVTVGRFGA